MYIINKNKTLLNYPGKFMLVYCGHYETKQEEKGELKGEKSITQSVLSGWRRGSIF